MVIQIKEKMINDFNYSHYTYRMPYHKIGVRLVDY